MASGKKSTRRKPVAAPAPGQRALPLSEVRSRLSPLVRTIELQQGAVAISVRGKVRAYLVAADRYERQRKPRARPWSLRGSLELIGSPDDLEEAIQQGHREALAGSLRAWDELKR